MVENFIKIKKGILQIKIKLKSHYLKDLKVLKKIRNLQ